MENEFCSVHHIQEIAHFTSMPLDLLDNHIMSRQLHKRLRNNSISLLKVMFNVDTTEYKCILLSLRFEVALLHIPYTVEFINRKLTNRIDF